MMNVPHLSEVLPHAEALYTRSELEAAIKVMANDIAADYAADPQPPLFVTILHGGLPFAGQLGFALGEHGLDVEFDYLHATRYRGNTTGSRLAWLHRPLTPMRGRRVLSMKGTPSRLSAIGARTRTPSISALRCWRSNSTSAAWTGLRPITSGSACRIATYSVTAWIFTNRGATCRVFLR